MGWLMKTKFKITPAVLDDIDSLVTLESRGFTTDLFGRNQFRYLITSPNSGFFVARAGRKIVGAAVILWRKNAHSGRLYNIVTDPSFQGGGIGSALIELCEREISRRGKSAISLEVRSDNKNAISFYRKRGYVDEKLIRGYYSDGVSAIKMRKSLVPVPLGEKHLKIPYYGQTLEFTCGPACMMMAFKYFMPSIKLTRTMELNLWKESTLIYTTSGMGGCGPYGMALAARRRGFASKVIISEDQPPFFSSVRKAYKRRVIALIHEDMKIKGVALGIKTEIKDITIDDIAREMNDGYVPIVLVSTYRLHGDRAPHWVVITGYDSKYVYFHDSFQGFYGHNTRAARNIKISLAKFNSMRRYGKGLYKSVILIGMPDIAPKVAIDGSDL